ncbi:MAG: NAD+ synthase [Anaerolineaceae bacterium]
MINLYINIASVRNVLIDFIRKEMARAGFNRAVVGLSGGLDSTMACYLAVEALGAANVLAVRMPYTTSSPESLEHAQLVIQATGVESLTIPISEMVDALINKFPDMNAFRKGNVMARARMIVLFDQSAANDALVVGTGNKTEILLGYTTLYGDAACAFNPLGDLYKTQVRQLAKEMMVPDVIIQKPPSADLWSGQTDEGELGFTYLEVDQLLYLLIDKQKTPSECETEGFSKEFIKKVIARVRKSAFKRKMPPIARLTEGETSIEV